MSSRELLICPKGSLKFTFQNERIKPEDTPLDVSSRVFTFPIMLSVLQFGMEDGDLIDANLEQVCPPYYYACDEH